MKKNKESNKKPDKVFIFLVTLLIIVSIILIVFRIVTGKNLDTDSNPVKELYSYFNTSDLSNCGGLFNYTGSGVKFDDLASDNKLCLAYHKTNLENVESENYKPEKKKETCKVNDNMTFRVTDEKNECIVTKIGKDTLNKTYKKLFNKDIDNVESFKPDNFNICYLKDDTYYCGLSETYTYTIGNDSSIYRVINYAREKGDNLYIYDFFVKINGDTCYKTFTTDIQNNECTDAYNKLKKDEKVEYKFLKKYGVEYKHTFKKNANGDYYWVSSEPTEKVS